MDENLLPHEPPLSNLPISPPSSFGKCLILSDLREETSDWLIVKIGVFKAVEIFFYVSV
jgi:hypothetical protein